MERYELINEIANFGYNHGIFNWQMEANEVKQGIGYMLDESAHIESLINTINTRAKNTHNLDVKRTKAILLELDRIRLDLEYNDESDSVHHKSYAKHR